ncbi:MAG: tetratricopeptide repeat protein [Anaerolineaceae bacterium]|nr:tetratricopeptide repeat protein [Anaerolineaceae bacterium]
MLQISLLGALQVSFNGEQAPRFVSEKARALLCYLVATGQPHSREALVGLLWGDDPEAKAKNSLRVALANLRKLFPGYIEATRQVVEFVGERPYHLDLHTFTTQLKKTADWQADIDELQAASKLYRGEFLADFQTESMPAFDEWLLAQRAYWDQKAQHIFATLAEMQLAAGAYAESVVTLRRLLQLEPWQESAHRQLMLALSHQGDLNGALAQYETCRQLLADELGVEPTAATTALYQQIQTARAGRPSHLPTPGTPLVGRQEELAHLSQMLLNPDCRLVTISGIGGMGKTRLALAVAHQLTQQAGLHFLDGVTFVPLPAVAATPSAADAVATAVAQTLQLHLPGRRAPAEEVLEYLEPEEQLLVLDNFEHLLDSVGWLAALLQRCPHLKLLVTSREPLNLAAEWRFPLAGLPYPTRRHHAPTLSRPETFAAVTLFVQTARQVKPDFTLTAENQPYISSLCQIVMGLPLAIKLAAAWLRVMPAGQLTQELRQNLDLLSTQTRDVPPRQRTVRAVFDATWEMLSAPEQQAFAAVSLFRGGFTAAAARQVAQATPFVLGELVDRGLIQLDATNRYQMHELLRQYAAEKLAANAAEKAQAAQAHSHYYSELLAQSRLHLVDDQHPEIFQTLRLEIDNIRAAWQTAVAIQDIDVMRAGLFSLGHFYYHVGWYREGIAVLQSAVTAVRALPQPPARVLLAQLLALCGMLTLPQGRLAEAAGQLHEAVQLAHEFEEGPTIALAEKWLGWSYYLRDDPRQADHHCQQALAVYRQLQDSSGTASVLNILGLVALARQQFDQAKAYHLEAMQTSHAHDTAVLNNLAQLAVLTGDYAAAQRYAEEGIRLVLQANKQHDLPYLYANLARAKFALGDLPGARDYFAKDLALSREVGDRRGEAGTLDLLGRLAIAEGKLDEAHDLLQKSLALNEALQRDFGIPFNYTNLGRWALATGDLHAAQAYCDTAYAQWQSRQNQRNQATVLALLAQIALRQQKMVQAATYLKEAELLIDGTKLRATWLWLQAHWAAYWRLQGDQAQADSLAESILASPAAHYETKQVLLSFLLD